MPYTLVYRAKRRLTTLIFKYIVNLNNISNNESFPANIKRNEFYDSDIDEIKGT